MVGHCNSGVIEVLLCSTSWSTLQTHAKFIYLFFKKINGAGTRKQNGGLILVPWYQSVSACDIYARTFLLTQEVIMEAQLKAE